jgi:hypothetical protein
LIITLAFLVPLYTINEHNHHLLSYYSYTSLIHVRALSILLNQIFTSFYNSSKKALSDAKYKNMKDRTLNMVQKALDSLPFVIGIVCGAAAIYYMYNEANISVGTIDMFLFVFISITKTCMHRIIYSATSIYNRDADAERGRGS